MVGGIIRYLDFQHKTVLQSQTTALLCNQTN